MKNCECYNCGKPCDPEKDFCYGCSHIICAKCSIDGAHHMNGAHWLRSSKNYTVSFDLPLTSKEKQVMSEAMMRVSGMQTARQLRRK